MKDSARTITVPAKGNCAITAYAYVMDKGSSLMIAVTKPCRKLGIQAGDTIKVTIERTDNGSE